MELNDRVEKIVQFLMFFYCKIFFFLLVIPEWH